MRKLREAAQLLAVVVTFIGGLGCLALLLPLDVWAGELYLGTIFVTDGGTANNANTTVTDAGRDGDGGLIIDGGVYATRYVSAAFAIPVNPGKITLQEQNRASFVGVQVPACDAGRCLSLAAAEKFPTSTGAAITVVYSAASQNLLYDAGINYTSITYTGGVVSVAPVSGCCVAVDVYSRNGAE